MDEKAIAKAIQLAQKLHEESWDGQEYAKDKEDCFIEACNKIGLPKQIWYVLYLANEWMNDLADWAGEILANRRTYVNE